MCLESYPCQGHEGVILKFEKGEKLTVTNGVSSVATGAIE
jgi:hypothetical protein